MASLRYSRIGITTKTDLPEKDQAIERILHILRREGAEILPKNTKDIDLMVVIGGDGTILRAIRELPDLSIPILSINRGAIGFLAETDMDETEDLLPSFLRGEGMIEQRKLLEVTVTRNGKTLFHDDHVLNEAVIAQGAIARLLDLHASVNGEELATFRADGLIVATPTGSTAYSLAAGGPIVHPQIEALILTPLNPHSFTQKPIVMPGNHPVDIEIRKRDVSLTLDGQSYQPLKEGDCVHIRIGDACATFLRRKQDTFYSTLRKKLKWGETP